MATDSDFFHDDTGNLVLDEKQFYKYDAWNRVVEVHSKFAADEQTVLMQVVGGVLTGTPEVLIAKYKYDAIGRRINKQVSNSGPLNTAGAGDFFYYDGHRVIEHHSEDAGGVLSLHRQYIYGLNYIDEVVAYYDGETTPALHFIFQDSNYNVVGVTDSAGALEQQYTYKPYGDRATAETVSGTAGDTTVSSLSLDTQRHLIATTKGHQGLDHMPEIDAVDNRARILKPKYGRFLQEDPNDSLGALEVAAPRTLCAHASKN